MEGASNTATPLGAALPSRESRPFRIFRSADYLDDVVVLDKPICKACGGSIRHTVTVGFHPQVYFHQRRNGHKDCRLGFWLDPDSKRVQQDVIRNQLSDREWVDRRLAILKERVR